MTIARTMTDDLGQRAIRGVATTALAFVSNRVFQLASTVLVARWLDPAILGGAYAAIAVVSFGQVVVDAGIGAAVVAGHDLGSLRATALVNMSTAVVLGSGVALAAPALSRAFGPTGGVGLYRLGALYLIVRGAGKVHVAVLERGLEFGRRASIDIASGIARLVATVVLVVQGVGASSLIWGMVAGEAATVVLLLVLVRLHGGSGRARSFRGLAGFSAAVVLARLSGELATNADYLIVGSRLGSKALGYYSIAYRVPELLLSQVYWIASSVLYPLLARAHRDGRPADGVLLEALGFLALWGVIVGFGLALIAPDAISEIFGSKWSASATPMTLVAIALGLHGLVFAIGDALKASGRVWFFAAAETSIAVVSVVTLLAVASHGVVWVAATHVVIAATWASMSLVAAVGLIGLRWSAILDAMRPALLVVGSLALTALPLRILLAPGRSRLALVVLAALASIAFVFAVVERERSRHILSYVTAKTR